MIQETYVSYEVAKLLKEKGFDYPFRKCYDPDGYLGDKEGLSGYIECYAYTQQMAMQWLRIAHNLFITIDCVPNEGFYADIYDLSVIDEYGSYKHISPTIAGGKTPKEVIDATIKYICENLI